LSSKDLRLQYAYPNSSKTISYSFYTAKDNIGIFQEMPFSYYLISKIKLEASSGLQYHDNYLFNEAIKSAQNYLFVRLSQGGGYYTYSLSSGGAYFEYQPQATDTLGLTYLLDFSLQQRRYCTTTDIDTHLSLRKSFDYLAYKTTNDNYVPQILSNGSF
jgi:hypothetical protein